MTGHQRPDGLDDALASWRRGDLTTDQEKAREQHQLAATGRAENQCPSCGSYRADGAPPLLHQRGCPETPPPWTTLEEQP